MRVSPNACAVMPWGGVLGLAWDVAIKMPLHYLCMSISIINKYILANFIEYYNGVK
jgi:hypothetical protein